MSPPISPSPNRRSEPAPGILALALAALFPLCAQAQAVSAWRVWESPQAMVRIDASMVPVERSSFCSENCRYDRHGDEPSPANPRPDRYLYLDAHGDAVFYDDPGAGVITRIWLTSGGPTPTCLDDTLRLKLYYGNATTPAIDLPLKQLFDGSTLPFQPPLSFHKDSGSGGYASYVPIHYANGVRLAIEGLDLVGACSTDSPPQPPRLWYQFDAQHLPPGKVTGNFALTDTFPDFTQWLGAEGSDPWSRGLPAQATSHVMAPATQWTIASDTGSGWLAGIRIQTPAVSWANLNLEILVDGEIAASMPLSRLHAVQTGDPVLPRSPLMGLDATDWLYLWWPVPYRQQIQLILRDSGLTGSHTVHVETYWDASTVPADVGRWFASRHHECSMGVDHQQTLLEMAGSGKLMALAGRFDHHGGGNPAYLEGDTRLRFDGAIAPQWQGSGLEDFYNGGFYFDWGRPYRQPWSGASAVDPQGGSAMWRILLADAPVYANGIDLLQEAGASPAEALDVCMDSVAYGYHTDQRALVPLARLEVGNPNDVQRYAYQPAPGASCAVLSAHYADAASTQRSRTVCDASSGSSSFHISLAEQSDTLRLRRVVDAGSPGQAAKIVINGVAAGYFPPARPDSVRRWQEQDAPLAVAPGTTELDISIVPLWGAHGDAGSFTESAYELWAVPGDLIYANGFEPSAP